MDLMVNHSLPEDLGSMGGRCHIHDAEQLKWADRGEKTLEQQKWWK